MKFGAFVECSACHAMPESDDDLVLSIALTDHYLPAEALIRESDLVKRGIRPVVEDAFRTRLLTQLPQVQHMLGRTVKRPTTGDASKLSFWAAICRKIAGRFRF